MEFARLGAFAALAATAGASHGRAADLPSLVLDVLSAPAVVFRWQTDRCADNHVPDAPARAWRDATGAVHLLASHYDNRPMIGAALDVAWVNCASVYQGRGADRPEDYDDKVWLTAFHTTDGQTVAALGHAEYHGHLRPQACPWRDYTSCWWNAVVGLVSHDGGAHFTRPGEGYLVAAPKGRYDPAPKRPVGYFSPSNILERDGFRYAFIFAEAYGDQRRGACLLRTATPESPSSWRAWDGKDFSVALAPEMGAAQGVCAPVPGLGSTVTSIVRHDATGTVIAVFAGTRATEPSSPARTGIYYVTSRDLLIWSAPELLLEMPLMFAYRCEDATAYGYPSLIDARGASRNFDVAGSEAFLYATRFPIRDCKLPMERDLVRFAVRIGKRS
jgi:hypothetical protein